MKAIKLTLSALLLINIVWIAISINQSINTILFYDWRSMWSFIGLLFLFVAYMKLSQTNEIH